MKIVLTLISIFALSGCQESPEAKPHALEQWVGLEVTVFFNRNLLGAAGKPIAPTSTWLNNTRLSLNGKISSTHENGIFIDSNYMMNLGDSDLRHSLFWIPEDSILTIEKKQ